MIVGMKKRGGREGIAVLEMALALPFLLTLIVGIWVVGRLVQTQAILSDAVYVAARQAAQGRYTDPATGLDKLVYTTDLKTTVLNCLQAAGVPVPNAATSGKFDVFFSGDHLATDPCNAYPGDKHGNVPPEFLTISATLAYDQFGWTSFGLFGPTGPASGSFTAPPSAINSKIQVYTLITEPVVVNGPPAGWGTVVLP